MPFEPVSPLGAFTDSPVLPEPPPEEESAALELAKGIGTLGVVGAGLALAPAVTVPVLMAGAGYAALAAPETTAAAFRTENSFGSFMVARNRGFDNKPFDRDFDPWAEIAGTTYQPYSNRFAGVRNREHMEAIKSDINRETKDKRILKDAGLIGTAASMAAGVLDWPTLLPGAHLARSAKGGVSILRTAASTAALGVAGAAVQEGALHATQQTRTKGETAWALGGSLVMAGAPGRGVGRPR
jgi:hypothetical protein